MLCGIIPLRHPNTALFARPWITLRTVKHSSIMGGQGLHPYQLYSILVIMWYASAALVCVYASNILAYALR